MASIINTQMTDSGKTNNTGLLGTAKKLAALKPSTPVSAVTGAVGSVFNTPSVQPVATANVQSQVTQPPVTQPAVTQPAVTQPNTSGGYQTQATDASGGTHNAIISNGSTYVYENGQYNRLPSGWSVQGKDGKVWQMGADGKGQLISDPNAGQPLDTATPPVDENPMNSELQAYLDQITKSNEDVVAGRAQASAQLDKLADPNYITSVVDNLMKSNQATLDNMAASNQKQADDAIRSTLASMESTGVINSGASEIIQNQVRDAYASLLVEQTGAFRQQMQSLASEQVGRIMQSVGMQGEWLGADANRVNSSIGDFVNTSLKATEMEKTDERFYASLAQDEKQFYDRLDSDNKNFYAKLSQDDRQFYTKISQDERFFNADMEQKDRQFNQSMAQSWSMHSDDMEYKNKSLAANILQNREEMKLKKGTMSFNQRMTELSMAESAMNTDLQIRKFDNEVERQEAEDKAYASSYMMESIGILGQMKDQGATNEEITAYSELLISTSPYKNVDTDLMGEYTKSLMSAPPEEIKGFMESFDEWYQGGLSYKTKTLDEGLENIMNPNR